MNILHRDLKSANVFLFSNGVAKLGDLNVSKVAKRGLVYTQTGTPYYACPEVWKDQPYDLKSDIWSLGCVLYEAATKQPPFKGGNMKALYHAVLRGSYQPLPKIYSSDFAAAIGAMLQVNPIIRPDCDKLLESAPVAKNIGNLRMAAQAGSSHLLQTIKLPANWRAINSQLPKPNYGPDRSLERKQLPRRQSRDRSLPVSSSSSQRPEISIQSPKNAPHYRKDLVSNMYLRPTPRN